MTKGMKIAKVMTEESVGMRRVFGVEAGDRILQAMAWSNGDDVSGVFAPIVPANEIVLQIKPVGHLEVLLVIERTLDDER